MLLIKLLRMIIADIDKHLYEKMALPSTVIPEASIAGKIAKLKVPEDFLIRHQPTALGLIHNAPVIVLEKPINAEIDELAENLAQLKVDHDLPFYNVELRFDMTWRALVELGPKEFCSVLMNKLQSESLEVNKMIIVARLKYQLQAHIKDSLLKIEARQAKWNEDSIVLEADCIDHGLFLTVCALIAEAQELCLKGREQLQQSPLQQVSLKSGPGKTERLLDTFHTMVAEYYEVMKTFDDKNQLTASHRYSLRDFLPMRIRSVDPIIQSHFLGMDYLLNNCREHAQAVVINEKPWSSYVNYYGFYDLGLDLIATRLRDESLSESKRYHVMEFFNSIQLYSSKQDSLFEDVLKLIDTHNGAAVSLTPYRSLISTQKLTLFYKTLHDKVLEAAPESDRKKHSLCCKT